MLVKINAQIVGIRHFSFKGKDGLSRSGSTLFFTYDQPGVDGVATGDVYLSDEADVSPYVGMTLEVVRNTSPAPGSKRFSYLGMA